MNKLPPQIHSIYIAKTAGAPMEQVQQANIIAGQGIAGDRYAIGTGAFSTSNPKIRHISLITSSGIAEANQYLEENAYDLFAESETRRNIIIDHFSSDQLNALLGKIFHLGGLAFKGVELCAPCQRPANLLSRQDFMKAFDGEGGLRAEALESGVLLPGDSLDLSIAKLT